MRVDASRESFPMMLCLIEDGKRQGYIDASLSTEAIMVYIDIVKEGAQIFARIPQVMREDAKIMGDLNRIMFYGFVNQAAAYPEDSE